MLPFDPLKPVTMCVCENITFAEIRAHGFTELEEIYDHLGCGLWCGGCVPYLIKMLETGEVQFAIIELG